MFVCCQDSDVNWRQLQHSLAQSSFPNPRGPGLSDIVSYSTFTTPATILRLVYGFSCLNHNKQLLIHLSGNIIMELSNIFQSSCLDLFQQQIRDGLHELRHFSYHERLFHEPAPFRSWPLQTLPGSRLSLQIKPVLLDEVEVSVPIFLLSLCNL